MQLFFREDSFKSVKVIQNKASLQKYHNQENSEEIRQV